MLGILIGTGNKAVNTGWRGAFPGTYVKLKEDKENQALFVKWPTEDYGAKAAIERTKSIPLLWGLEFETDWLEKADQ